VSAPTEELASVIDAHLRGLITDRGDGAWAHVSDCFGCDRATWERRQGTASGHERDAKACLKIQLGVDIERYVCDGLEAYFRANDFWVARDHPILWNPDLGRNGATTFAGSSENPMPPIEAVSTHIVGHADLYAWNNAREESVLIECKSTSFFRGKVPTEPSEHYAIQTATYAIALGASKAGIIIVCRESGRVAGPFWLDLDALESATIARAKEVLAVTSPDNMIPPEARPRYSWQPKYCGMGSACACLAAANADNTAEQLERSLA
jgi:hypothetical protein